MVKALLDSNIFKRLKFPIIISDYLIKVPVVCGVFLIKHPAHLDI